MDVKNIWLHGDMKKEAFIEQSLGFVEKNSKKWVFELQKSLYGLKQASWLWFDSFSYKVQEYGFWSYPLDHSLFIYKEIRKPSHLDATKVYSWFTR